VLSDRVTVTPFAEVVRDFAEVPETRDTGTLSMVLVSTGREELEPELLLPDLLAGGAFLLLDWGSWDLIAFLRSVVRSF
jgi:hypothetical protein